MICAVVMTDGRIDCLAKALESFDQQVHGPVTRRVIHDDTGDPSYHQELADRFPGWELLTTPGRSGFGGAYRSAWQWVAANVAEPFVFSTEDDFTYNRPVDLADLADVLDSQPNLVQLALRRQPWNDAERLAGGIVEQHPEAYADIWDSAGRAWLEHRLFFTTNPSLIRTNLCAGGWPNVAHSEGIFTHQMLRNTSARFGFWGARNSGEWVTHIGHERVGTGY